MTVPKISQLRSGVGVNVVLKADQRSGRLTSGSISEILTRGDHPRGVKVRLNSGEVGRVQSLEDPSSDGISSETHISERELLQSHTIGRGSSGQRGRHSRQVDYRQDPTPLESCSLADYVKLPRPPLPASASSVKAEEPALQTQMELEFPKLDSALIAAILADYSESAEAKSVLSALS